MKWNSVNLIFLCEEIFFIPRFFDASAGSSSVWWIHGETVTRCSQLSSSLVSWWLPTSTILIRWKNHEAAVSDTCWINISEPCRRCGIRDYYSKLLLSWRCRRDFWLLNLVFVTRLEGEKKYDLKKKKTHTHLMRFSQGLQMDAGSIRKKKSDLKINHSPIWDATTRPAAPCRLFKQRCQTAGGVHPEGKTTRGSFMRRN